MRTIAMTGERASGRTTPRARRDQWRAPAPWTTIAAPANAPVMACVVETGSPAREAKKIQAAAPMATGRRKDGPRIGVARKFFPENVAMSPCVANAAKTAPTPVQVAPQATAVRSFETPLPTRVAMPFETSFDPFAHATAAATAASVRTGSVTSAARSTTARGARIPRGTLRRDLERDIAPGLEDMEGAGVGGMRELGRGVGADLDLQPSRKRVPLLVDDGLRRPEVHRALSPVDAAGRLLELPTAHGHRVEGISLDRFPGGPAEHLDPIEAGLLERRNKALGRESAD